MTLADEMNAQDFDHVWTVQDGHVVDAKGYAPTVAMFELEPDVWSDEEVESEGWEPVSAGFTGQYGYSGPVMHASETFGQGMAERLAELAEDYSAFATVAVECINLAGEREDTPAGWMVVGRIAR